MKVFNSLIQKKENIPLDHLKSCNNSNIPYSNYNHYKNASKEKIKAFSISEKSNMIFTNNNSENANDQDITESGQKEYKINSFGLEKSLINITSIQITQKEGNSRDKSYLLPSNNSDFDFRNKTKNINESYYNFFQEKFLNLNINNKVKVALQLSELKIPEEKIYQIIVLGNANGMDEAMNCLFNENNLWNHQFINKQMFTTCMNFKCSCDLKFDSFGGGSKEIVNPKQNLNFTEFYIKSGLVSSKNISKIHIHQNLNLTRLKDEHFKSLCESNDYCIICNSHISEHSIDFNLNLFNARGLEIHTRKMENYNDNSFKVKIQCFLDNNIEDKNNFFKCMICLEIFNNSSLSLLLKCDHKCCEQCFRKYIYYSAKLIPSFVKCPDLKCNFQIEIESLINCNYILYKDNFRKRYNERKKINEGKGLFCTRCGKFLNIDSSKMKIECTHCRKEICTQCKFCWHPKSNCEDFLTKMFRKGNMCYEFQCCPACFSTSRKCQFCNDLTCIRCNSSFCKFCHTNQPRKHNLEKCLNKMNQGKVEMMKIWGHEKHLNRLNILSLFAIFLIIILASPLVGSFIASLIFAKNIKCVFLNQLELNQLKKFRGNNCEIQTNKSCLIKKINPSKTMDYFPLAPNFSNKLVANFIFLSSFIFALVLTPISIFISIIFLLIIVFKSHKLT